MSMKKFKLIVIAMLIMCIGNAYAQKTKLDPEIEKLKDDVESIKDYKDNIDSYSKAVIQKIENRADEKVQAKLDELKIAEYGLFFLAIIGIPTALYTVYELIWGLKKKTSKLIMEKIGVIVEKNREDILRVVETEMFDNRIRKTKRLLIIGTDEESNQVLIAFLERMKFKNVISRIEGRDENLPDHDLIIFNTPEGELNQNIINSFLEDADESDTYFVAYSRARLEPHSRLTFASSQITLYHNILQALKFMEISRALND